MTIFYSHFHNLYVAQMIDNGDLITGRGYTFADAIITCLASLNSSN